MCKEYIFIGINILLRYLPLQINLSHSDFYNVGNKTLKKYYHLVTASFFFFSNMFILLLWIEKQRSLDFLKKDSKLGSFKLILEVRFRLVGSKMN